ncbi:hypothetical protein GEMRC1_003771 [Eukaryota sp. GEM-RC1]
MSQCNQIKLKMVPSDSQTLQLAINQLWYVFRGHRSPSPSVISVNCAFVRSLASCDPQLCRRLWEYVAALHCPLYPAKRRFLISSEICC